MGCSVTGKLQPSLQYFYEGIEEELYDGMKLDYIKNPDVSYLAKQGVLMYNVALTTEHGKAGNHLDIWNPFAKYFFQEVVGYTGIPIIFLGKEAGKCDKYVTPFTHTFHLTHPAYAARMNTIWETEGVFKKVSKIVKENNGFSIDWLDTIPF
jgi:uracil DNA glycosylase